MTTKYTYSFQFPLTSDNAAAAVTAEEFWTAIRLYLHSITEGEIGAATMLLSSQELPDGPIAAETFATVAYVDEQVALHETQGGPFLPLTGGTVTGPLNAASTLSQGYAASLPTWAGASGANNGLGWAELIGEAHFYTKSGGAAVVAVGRSSDYTIGPYKQIYAFLGYGLSDVAGGIGEAAYLEGHKAVDGATSICIEMDAVNTGSAVPTINPYQVLNTGACAGIVIASGGGTGGGGRPGPFYSASAAMIIDRNNVDFLKGIVFGATGLNGTDGVTGSGVAIELAKGHEIRWTVDTYGARGGFIRCDAVASGWGLEIQANSLNVVDAATETVYLQVASGGTSVTGALLASQGLQINDAGGPVIRGGSGVPDANLPKGSMWLRTDGGVGSTFYITQGGGSWAGVAGV